VAQWLLITSVIFLASTLQSMTGFGFAVLAVPLLVPLLPPRDAVALITLLSTATTVPPPATTTTEPNGFVVGEPPDGEEC